MDPVSVANNETPFMRAYLESVVATVQAFAKYIEYKLAGGALTAVYAFFFSPDIKQALLAILMLVAFDLVTALLAAKKTGEVIQSKRVFKSAVKVAVYGLTVSAGHLTDVATGLDSSGIPIDFEFAILGFLAVTELVSVLENVGKMGYAIPQKLLNQLEEYRDSR